MLAKKLLVAAVALSVVAGGTFAYSSGSSLQGKFGAPVVKTTSPITKSASTSPVMTLTNKNGSADSRTISVSSVDYTTVWDSEDEFTTDPKAFSLATVSMKFANGATPCSGNDSAWTFLLTDDKSYGEFSDQIFDKFTLDFRSTTDRWWTHYMNNTATDASLAMFTPDSTVSSLTGSDYYFYVEGTVKNGIDSSLYDQPLSLYLRDACAAAKDGTKYLWTEFDKYGQNSYFGFASDGKYGYKIGSLKITK